MKVALYARVSSEAQQARGTIGSQLELLRARVTAEGHELVAEFCDDGYSGARLDRPGLDALRDQAEAGAFDAIWCLSPDRLARAYAYQVLILDELEQFGVRVLFSDAPPLDDDPQARLLTQVQGVIAEYERAKISERNRRGRLFRARAGEIVTWKAPDGYRRVPRDATGPARLVVFEPEAAVVRRVYDDYVNGGLSIRHIMRALNTEQIPTPTGKAEWWHSTLCRILTNEAYVGRVYFNQTETIPTTTTTNSARRRPTTQRRRPRDEWIEIPCPPILDDAIFEAAQRVSRDNSKWSPRNLHDEAWLAARNGPMRRVRHLPQLPQAGPRHRQGPSLLHLPQQGAQRRPRPATVPGTLRARGRPGRLRLRAGQGRPAPPHRPLRRRVGAAGRDTVNR